MAPLRSALCTLWLCAALTQATYLPVLQSPDLDYVLNHVAQDTELPALPQVDPLSPAAPRPGSQPGYAAPAGGDEQYANTYAAPSDRRTLTSVYANSAGDEEVRQESGYDAATSYQSSSGQPGGQGPDPGSYIVPVNPAYISHQQPDLSGFGHSLEGGQSPAGSPSSPGGQGEARDGLGSYIPVRRQILPSPYSGQKVPYSLDALQNSNNAFNFDNSNSGVGNGVGVYDQDDGSNNNNGNGYDLGTYGNKDDYTKGSHPDQHHDLGVYGKDATNTDAYNYDNSNSGVGNVVGVYDQVDDSNNNGGNGYDLGAYGSKDDYNKGSHRGPDDDLDVYGKDAINTDAYNNEGRNGYDLGGYGGNDGHNTGSHQGHDGSYPTGVVDSVLLPTGGQGRLGQQGGGPGGPNVPTPDYVYPTDVGDYRDQLKCWPQFFLQYERDFSGDVWQDVKGHVHVQDGRAVFDGQGFLAIPFFACNDLLPRYSMIFYISPSYSGTPQAVLGNSAYPHKASLLVALTGNTLTLVVRQRQPNLLPNELLQQCHSHRKKRSFGSSLGLPVQGSVSGGGYGLDSGDIVVLQVTIPPGEVMVTIAQENDWIFFGAGNQHDTKPGRLPTLTNEALYVGSGADPRGGGDLAHYTGTFDSFLFEKCP